MAWLFPFWAMAAERHVAAVGSVVKPGAEVSLSKASLPHP